MIYHFDEKSTKLKKLISNNLNLIKQVGRVNQILDLKTKEKNMIDILVLKEKISLKFNEEIDLFLKETKY